MKRGLDLTALIRPHGRGKLQTLSGTRARARAEICEPPCVLDSLAEDGLLCSSAITEELPKDLDGERSKVSCQDKTSSRSVPIVWRCCALDV